MSCFGTPTGSWRWFVRSFVFQISLVVVFAALGNCIASWAQAKADSSRFDGPAELPRQYVKSSLLETPAPGKSVLVKNAVELSAAIEKAACGDTIRLQAGTEFAGNFTLPAKPCDDAHWIVLRTSAADADFPPEGKRITPCYAGIASLPGRPTYTCSNPTNVMAKVVFTKNGSGPLKFNDGANHYRFIGLEITRDSPGATVYNLASFGGADHVVFDRVWMHGTAQDETTRGIALGGSRYVAVIDSYLNDFHCVAITGSCVDSQTIAGGLGTREMGPYKIVNNFLEAAAENVIFGGGAATTSPADIEIRRNYMFKPMIWRPGADHFVGGTSGKPFIVKNLFELKNAQRVLVEDNIMENTWGGFSQSGFAILLTPKNQGNQCPLCKTTDVVIRFNRVSHMGSAMQMGTGLSDAGGAASGGERYSIHDNVFDDIGGKDYEGFGAFAQVSSMIPTLRDIRISHNTAFPPKALFILGVGVDREKIINFEFTDNLMGVGEIEIFPTGGGASNCAFQPRSQGPTNVLKKCFSNAVVTGNVFIGSEKGWPEGNFYSKDASSVLEDFRGGKSGNYRVCRGKQSRCKKAAPFVGKASGGKDPGADVEAVNSATAGVE
jgi:hypothetical protein